MHYLLPSHHLLFPSDQSPVLFDSHMQPVARLAPQFRGKFSTSKTTSFFNLSRNTCKRGDTVWFVDKLKRLHRFDLSRLAPKIDQLRRELSTADCPVDRDKLPVLEGEQLCSEAEEFCVDPHSPARCLFVLSTDGTVRKLQSNDGTRRSAVFVVPKEHQKKQRVFTAISCTPQRVITACICKHGKQFRVQYLSLSKRLELQDCLSMTVDSENPVIRIVPLQKLRVTFCLAFHAELLLQVLFLLGQRPTLLCSLNVRGASNKLLRGALVDKRCGIIWVPTSQRMFQLNLLSR